MPIVLPVRTRRISQTEFGEIAYRVMEHVFAIHKDFGRLFDEKIYKRELAGRMNSVALEVPVTVSYSSFSKTYSLDVLVSESGLFEFKATGSIHPRHRGQTVNYLLLADLAHGKIINVRPERVEHEFVNCQHRLAELRNPAIHLLNWDGNIPGADRFLSVLQSLVADWGCGLEVSLYEEAIGHFLCGQASLPVTGVSGVLGFQSMRMANTDVAFKLTALKERHNMFAIHAKRLLHHLPLKSILWANMELNVIRLETIQ